MSRRIDVELTSERDDGTWTWRAAGARQPKGDLPATLLYSGAKVGDVCRVEAEFLLDGIEIIEVFAPKAKKERTDLLEMVSRPVRDDELVTEVKASRPRGRGDGKRRDGRKGKGDRDRRDGRGKEGRGADGRGRDGRKGEGRGDDRRRDRRPRPDPMPERPKAKRLRPRRTHRDAALAAVPEEHRPIAEQVLQGGLPAVRTAIEKQNAEAKAEGKPEIPVQTVLSIAEPLVNTMRAAEWHDRADAAKSDMDEIDLRDLRSVVGASDAARDDEARALAEELRNGLNERIEKDHQQWLDDLGAAMKAGRTVRALRLSSRPVKAGQPLPPELSADLADAASASLSADIAQDRWATVLDAVAFSPVRVNVTPAGYPAEPNKELLEAVRRVADRMPEVAAKFSIDPAEASKARKRRPDRKRPKKTKPAEKPAAEKPTDEQPTDEQPTTEAPAAESPASTDSPTAEAPSADAPTAGSPASTDSATEEPAAETPNEG